MFLFLVQTGFSQTIPTHQQPNIVLLMADDMGFECLSIHGSLSYETPFLDELARKNIHFLQAHSQPLCTPSRVKIMTGRYNYRNYKAFGYLDVNEKTFGNYLQEAGYASCVVGKWQLNRYKQGTPDAQYVNRPHHFGFDEYCVWNFIGKGGRYANPLLYQNGEKLETTEEDYGPDIVSEYAVKFMEQNKDQPFFLYYPMILTHGPFVPTPDSEEWADPKTRQKRDKRFFADMMAYTDKIVKKLADKLDELGIRDNTIFMFTSDNGTHYSLTTQTTSGPFPGGKGTMPDAGNHVPMIVSWPNGGQEGVIYKELIEFSDFLPTILEAAGIPRPSYIDGESFYPILNGTSHQSRETIFVHYDPLRRGGNKRYYGRFVRNKDYKLYNDGRFYHVREDKWETQPLSAHDLTAEQLRLKIAFQLELDQAPPHHFKQSHEYNK